MDLPIFFSFWKYRLEDLVDEPMPCSHGEKDFIHRLENVSQVREPQREKKSG
jgi:hypothetical protein